MVGFVATVGLMLLIVVSLIGLAMTWHVKSTLLDAAAEGARAGALDGAGVVVAIQRTEDILVGSDAQVQVDAWVSGGVMHVRARTSIPLAGFLGDQAIEVIADAPIE